MRLRLRRVVGKEGYSSGNQPNQVKKEEATLTEENKC